MGEAWREWPAGELALALALEMVRVVSEQVNDVRGASVRSAYGKWWAGKSEVGNLKAGGPEKGPFIVLLV